MIRYNLNNFTRRISVLLTIVLIHCLAASVLCQDLFTQRDYAQNRIDSLLRAAKVVKSDTNQVIIWNALANYHKFGRADSGIYYATKAIKLARKLNYLEGELQGLQVLALSYNTLRNYSSALSLNLEGLRKSEKANADNMRSLFLLGIGHNYDGIGNYNMALLYYRKAISIFKLLQNTEFVSITMSYACWDHSMLGNIDSAFYYLRSGEKIADSINISWVRALNYSHIGEVYKNLNNSDSALFYFRRSMLFWQKLSVTGVSWNSSDALDMAQIFESKNEIDSCINYAEMALDLAIQNKLYAQVSNAAGFLSNLYKEDNPIKALQFSQFTNTYNDSLEYINKIAGFNDLINLDARQREEELEAAQKEYQTRIRMNTLLGSIFTLLVIAFFLFRNNRNKQKAKKEIEASYNQLKATQSQLIQSEKMASLGELTAGIAHEIQNPLNFVNNFSEVNKELLQEMQDEIKKGNIEEANKLANDLIDNQEKINQHGKRADGIVKGMLQHSRGSSDKKELADINALCDEYLRLAYHGYRAKDKTFNANFETDFDESIPKLNIVPQDIGRVVLNLINNAFYAVSEKKRSIDLAGLEKKKNGDLAGLKDPQGLYEPTVTVTTKNLGDKIEIRVKDNGNGIPEHIKQKIFQPFFTTKPTGQGTGLGLSLSYDILKAHNGELSLDSREGEYTEFTIVLPS